ncbi:MAG TPA: hypothetical protein VIQ56_01930 [Gaiella sp.]|jgi:hypothetical protein
MGRRVRLKLLGDGWHAFGGTEIPADRVIEVSEAEAANFLRHRGSSRSVEVLGWIDEQEDEIAQCVAPEEP